MKNIFFVLTAALICTNCALVDYKNNIEEDNRQRKGRIADKESQLMELEKENADLKEKKWALAEELKGRKLALHQINNELDSLIRQNKKMARMKQKQLQNVRKLEQAIQELEIRQQKIVQLEQNDLTAAEKEREIQKLRKDIRDYLLLSLKEEYRPGSK